MLRSFLKLSIRNLVKSKLLTIINITGLTIGLSMFIFLIQYVHFESSYDNFHPDNIYQVSMNHQSSNQYAFHHAVNFAATALALKDAFQEIIAFNRLFSNGDKYLITYNNINIEENSIAYTDSSFFTMFNFPLVKGNPEQVLKEPNNIVISETKARQYFGNEEPIGKFIALSMGTVKVIFQVSGVLKDIPTNSQFKFDVFIPFQVFKDFFGQNIDNNWGWTQFYTFIKLQPNCDYKKLENKFPEIIKKYKSYLTENGVKEDFYLFPIKDVYLNDSLIEKKAEGNSLQVGFLRIIAFLILAIAWFNYINLTMANSYTRSKELSIRKVLGTNQYQTGLQLLSETLNLIIICSALSWVTLKFCNPYFIELIGKDIYNSTLDPVKYWFLCISVFIVTGIFSCLLPAKIITSLKPTDIFRGKYLFSIDSSRLRNFLNLFQLTVSIILIAFTIIIFQQVHYMSSREIGMSIEEVLVIEAPIEIQNDSTFENNAKYFKNELLRIPAVTDATITMFVPCIGGMSGEGGYIRRIDTDPKDVKSYRTGKIDYDFLNVFQIDLIAGRNFSKEFKNDRNRSVLVNETAAKTLGFQSPGLAVNKDILFPVDGLRDGKSITVVGVMQDFQVGSLEDEISPLICQLNEASFGYFCIKMNTGDITNSVNKIKKLWTDLFIDNPINYYFLDSKFNTLYNSQKKFGYSFIMFSVVAIFIACIGILGLTAFILKKSIKEIGIRKINGAVVANIMALLSKGFVKRVAIAFIVASPVAWYFMNKWLQNFAYKTELSWWVFALAGIIVLLIVLLTVSWQSWRAATRNPVEALRYE